MKIILQTFSIYLFHIVFCRIKSIIFLLFHYIYGKIKTVNSHVAMT